MSDPAGEPIEQRQKNVLTRSPSTPDPPQEPGAAFLHSVWNPPHRSLLAPCRKQLNELGLFLQASHSSIQRTVVSNYPFCKSSAAKLHPANFSISYRTFQARHYSGLSSLNFTMSIFLMLTHLRALTEEQPYKSDCLPTYFYFPAAVRELSKARSHPTCMHAACRE
jgi:hypothetical protein